MSGFFGRRRALGAVLATIPLVATAALAAPQAGAAQTADGDSFRSVIDETLSVPTGTDDGNPGTRVPTNYRPLHTGLDNPRQIALTVNGGLVVAEAGHGGRHCIGSGGNQTCIGFTGSVSVFRGQRHQVMGGLHLGCRLRRFLRHRC